MDGEVLAGGAALGDRLVALLGVPDGDGWMPAAELFGSRLTVEGWMYTDRATCCLAFRTTVNQAREQPYCSACPVLPPATTQELFVRATAAYTARFPRT